MELVTTDLAEVKGVKLRVFRDARGLLVKTFQADSFAALGLADDFRESYFSVSAAGVLRGMHFQTPPADHAKLVALVRGRVLDVALCLRRQSPDYGRWAAIELTLDGSCQAIYLPSGYAHGFLSLEDDTILQYLTTTVHAPTADCGIRWDSFGFVWPVASPCLSARDASLPPLADFVSPF